MYNIVSFAFSNSLKIVAFSSSMTIDMCLNHFVSLLYILDFYEKWSFAVRYRRVLLETFLNRKNNLISRKWRLLPEIQQSNWFSEGCKTVDRVVKRVVAERRKIRRNPLDRRIISLAGRVSSEVALLRVGRIRYEITDRSPTPHPSIFNRSILSSIESPLDSTVHRHFIRITTGRSNDSRIRVVTTQLQLIVSSIQKRKKKKEKEKRNKRSRFETIRNICIVDAD